MLVFWDGTDADDAWWSCSGTLISERVVLTAGHCTYGAIRAWASFESRIDPPTLDDFVRGTPYVHPGYDDFATFPNTSDVGVVILKKPVRMKTYGELPKIGEMNRYEGAEGPPPHFTIVGYGVQVTVGNRNEWVADWARYQGDPMLVELNSANTGGYNIHLGSNPGEGNGKGGACFGDSGGPAFLPGSDTVLAGVGSFVLSQNCVGSGFYYRVDTEHALGFIKPFLKGKRKE
jgi:hypothetical protein